MSAASRCHEPGLLCVLTKPKSPAFLHDFHDWYNTEHGPARMQLDFIQTGYRYVTAGDDPVWAGIYDLSRVSAVTEPSYTHLRKFRSKREQDIMQNKLEILERKIYRRISSRGSSAGPAPVILRVSFVVKDSLVQKVHDWYEQEHIADLQKIPGWRRSRRFELVDGDNMATGYTELLAMHEFESVNGLDGAEHVIARSRPWRDETVRSVESRSSQQVSFYHEFRAEDYRSPEIDPSSVQDLISPPLSKIGSDIQSGLIISEHAKGAAAASCSFVPVVS